MHPRGNFNAPSRTTLDAATTAAQAATIRDTMRTDDEFNFSSTLVLVNIRWVIAQSSTTESHYHDPDGLISIQWRKTVFLSMLHFSAAVG